MPAGPTGARDDEHSFSDSSATLTFPAPEEEGLYPYVCTYPGHGVVMYGTMYAFDTVPITVRYAWSGGFVDNSDVFYRSDGQFPRSVSGDF